MPIRFPVFLVSAAHNFTHMRGSVIYKARPPVKRVVFKAKDTTRGARFRQYTVQPPSVPLRSPSKPSQPVDVEVFESGGYDEPLIQHKSKVCLKFLLGKICG